MIKFFKISFCTVCMNRLEHLQQTLKKNINDNEDYDNLEFVLLDYNSTDGLEDFVKIDMHKFLSNGKLVYYKISTPEYFDRAHSRNIAFKLATGDIVCNIDADNYTGPGFAKYINHEFNNNSNIVLSYVGSDQSNKKVDVLGRICVKKNFFLEIKGYDERMKNYGFEDFDLINRLKLYGLKSTAISDNLQFSSTIQHKNSDRLSNEFILKNLEALLICYLTPASSDVIFLFRNRTYKKGIVINNKNFKFSDCLSDIKKSQVKYKYSILQDEWLCGEWEKCGRDVNLYKKEKLVLTMIADDGNIRLVTNNNNQPVHFYCIKNIDLIQEMAMFCSQITNRVLMYKNKLQAKVVVNEDFGQGQVYKNFSHLSINI